MKIKLHDKEFTLTIPTKKIQDAVQDMADEMNAQLFGRDVIFVAILNGAFMFASDLFKRIEFNAQISFIKFASYAGTKSTGHVRKLIGLNENLEGKTVVILEDIIDSGITMEKIIDQIQELNPLEVRVASLLVKPDAFMRSYQIDYLGIEIPNDFIVGYGLDYNGYGRNLTAIYTHAEALAERKISKVKYFLLFGPPGSGKGTQSKKIIEKYNLVHLSTGDILRKELETNSRLGQIAKNHMNKGGLVPDDIILGMVAKEIDANKGTSGVVLDGFPRTVEQAKGLDQILESRNYEVSAMFALDVPKEELVQRLLDRGKAGGRVDDTPEIIEKRIQTYNLTTLKVAEHYLEKGKLHEINGVGKIDDIFEDIATIIDNMNEK
jgi:adenylate kinase